MLPSTSSDRGGDAHLHPSPRLVMTTLLLVSLPIEIIFLATVHAFGWLDLPFIFMLFQVIFFAFTVCHDLASFIAQVYTNFIFVLLLFAVCFVISGHHLVIPLANSHELSLEAEFGSGHVRSSGSLCVRGPCRTAAPRGVLRSRFFARSESGH